VSERKAKTTSGSSARHPKPSGRHEPITRSAAALEPVATKPTRDPSIPPAALETFALGKDYGGVPALTPLDLAIEPGESVVLIGHNGSGKTTLLRMAAGLLEPSEGHALIHGEPTGSLPARSAVSFLADNPTFYDDLSVWEHLEYIARLHGMVEWEQQAADLLGHLGLYERADDLPIQFSRGLRQKAAIATGLIRPFALLLVDEPFVGLDAAGKVALLDLLDDAHQEGATLVVATHELEFVERVQRCVALRDGQVIHDGPAAGVDVLTLVS
jgi:ABC-type multidrug transport system ATPase subunit